MTVARSVAILAWSVAFGVVAALVLDGHEYTTIPYDVYTGAARHWREHAPLYDLTNVDGFQYLPQAAWVFAPFELLGTPVGGVLWRLVSWAAFAHGIWRLAHHLVPDRAGQCFLLSTALAITPALGSLGAGQSNLLLGALILQSTADLIERRYWRCTALIGLGLAAKPLMIVPVLLIAALYRPMRWRVPLAVGALLLMPFFVDDAPYVWTEYRDFLAKSRLTAHPNRLFEDADGLMTTFGWTIRYDSFLRVRVAAAIATLGLGALARHRLREPQATLHVAALAVTYLMLFNPRTQSNSYLMPTAFAALLVASHVLDRHRIAALATLVVVLSWYGNSHRLGWPEFWLKPLGCAMFGVLLLWRIARPNRYPICIQEDERSL